jgi:pilus assembly protein CpaD
VTLLAGCSQDFATPGDVYVPVMAHERFPIEVRDTPFKMTVSARSGKLSVEDASRLAGFAGDARSKNSSPVHVTYPSGSKKAGQVSQEAVRVLVSHGVPRSQIRTAAYTGKSDLVSLTFSRRTASTKPCGDWSQDVAINARNEPYPNYGCAIQNNMAAMVANPDDFERPREAGPSHAVGRMPGMQQYKTGEWSQPKTGSLLDVMPGGSQ